MTNAQSKYENLNPSKLSLKEKKGYFSMLNKNEMRSLQDMYKDDFDNFEYDPNAFDWNIIQYITPSYLGNLVYSLLFNLWKECYVFGNISEVYFSNSNLFNLENLSFS